MSVVFGDFFEKSTLIFKFSHLKTHFSICRLKLITACAAFRNPDSIPSKYFLAPSPSTLACSPSPRRGTNADRNDTSRHPPPCMPIHRASDVATASRPTPPRRRSPARPLAGNDDPAHLFAATANRTAAPAAPRPRHPSTLTVRARLFHVSSGNTRALQRSPRQPADTRRFPRQNPFRTDSPVLFRPSRCARIPSRPQQRPVPRPVRTSCRNSTCRQTGQIVANAWGPPGRRAASAAGARRVGCGRRSAGSRRNSAAAGKGRLGRERITTRGGKSGGVQTPMAGRIRCADARPDADSPAPAAARCGHHGY